MEEETRFKAGDEWNKRIEDTLKRIDQKFDILVKMLIDQKYVTEDEVVKHLGYLPVLPTPASFPILQPEEEPAIGINEESIDSSDASSLKKEVSRSIHTPPAFGSSSNLEALALEASKSPDEVGETAVNHSSKILQPMPEITVSKYDKPKLSQLTPLLAEVGLNIQETPIFSTTDGYSLQVFVVEGWPFEEVAEKCQAEGKFKIENGTCKNSMRTGCLCLSWTPESFGIKKNVLKSWDEVVTGFKGGTTPKGVIDSNLKFYKNHFSKMRLGEVEQLGCALRGSSEDWGTILAKSVCFISSGKKKKKLLRR